MWKKIYRIFLNIQVSRYYVTVISYIIYHFSKNKKIKKKFNHREHLSLVDDFASDLRDWWRPNNNGQHPFIDRAKMRERESECVREKRVQDRPQSDSRANCNRYFLASWKCSSRILPLIHSANISQRILPRSLKIRPAGASWSATIRRRRLHPSASCCAYNNSDSHGVSCRLSFTATLAYNQWWVRYI